MMNETEVLIVGAGPAGLTLAVELSRRKVPYILLEKHKTRSPYSRAMGMHPRTLEVYSILDPKLVSDLLERAYKVHNFHITKEIYVSLDTLDSPYHYSLVVPQTETEEVLEACLTRHGGQIWKGAKFVSSREVGQDGKTSIIATIEKGDGSTTEIRASYVCGTDGHRSAVREVMGVPFEGFDYDWTALMGDVKVNERADIADGLHDHSTPNGVCLTIPFKGEYIRILVFDRRLKQLPSDYHLTLEDLQNAVDAVTPGKKLSDPRWLTHWKASLKMVRSYRVGNYFLLGDAAHIHSPAGGQGLNTSVQDSVNLGWKLASVVRGRSPPSILDTYDSERRPVGAHVLWLSNTILTGILMTNIVLVAIRNFICKTFLWFPQAHKGASRMLSAVNISYRKQKKVRFGVFSRIAHFISGMLRMLFSSPRVETGDRFPAFAVRSDEQTEWKSSFDLMASSIDFKLVIFVKGNNHTEHLNKIQSSARYVKDRYGVPLIVVSQSAAPATWSGKGLGAVQCEAVDSDVLSVGASHGDFLLIRPDGYVGGRGSLTRDSNECVSRAIEQWLLPL